jgi:hypothetical protein
MMNGQAIAYVSSGNEWQATQINWLSRANWNGNNYACDNSVAGVDALLPTSPVDITGIFHEPFVIQ